MAGPAKTLVGLALAAIAAGPPGLANAQDYTVYAAGDIAWCDHPDPKWSGAAATATVVEAGLAANSNAAVLLLGDISYPRGGLREFNECYHPTWGRFKDRTWPSPGNHEYQTPGARGYFDYFGSAAGPGYYRIKLGSWQVYSLNSNLAPGPAAAQLAWLQQELGANPSHCILAYWHHPLYSSGGHGSMARMGDAWQALHGAGAEVILSGHDHDYERFAPQDAAGRYDARGIRQFVVGTGGAYATPFLLPLRNSEMRDNNRTGVLRLVLKEGAYTWAFLEAGYQGFPNGNAPDRGEGQCH